MLADAVSKASPDGMRTVHDEAGKAHTEQVSSDMISALLATIESQRQTIQDLMTSQERSRLIHEAEIARLNERIASVESALRNAQACITELAAAHWWEKKRIVARYALPPAKVETITGDDSVVVI